MWIKFGVIKSFMMLYFAFFSLNICWANLYNSSYHLKANMRWIGNLPTYIRSELILGHFLVNQLTGVDHTDRSTGIYALCARAAFTNVRDNWNEVYCVWICNHVCSSLLQINAKKTNIYFARMPKWVYVW